MGHLVRQLTRNWVQLDALEQVKHLGHHLSYPFELRGGPIASGLLSCLSLVLVILDEGLVGGHKSLEEVYESEEGSASVLVMSVGYCFVSISAHIVFYDLDD